MDGGYLDKIKAVLESESDDFEGLLNLTKLDISKDFIGSDLSGVDFGAYDYTSINLMFADLTGAVSRNGLIIDANGGNDIFNGIKDFGGRDKNEGAISRFLATNKWSHSRSTEKKSFSYALMSALQKVRSKKYSSLSPAPHCLVCNDLSAEEIIKWTQDAFSAEENRYSLGLRTIVTKVFSQTKPSSFEWEAKDLTLRSTFPESQIAVEFVNKNVAGMKMSFHVRSEDNRLLRSFKDSTVRAANLRESTGVAYIIICENENFAKQMVGLIKSPTILPFQLILVTPFYYSSLVSLLQRRVYNRDKVVINYISKYSKIEMLKEMKAYLEGFGFAFREIESQELSHLKSTVDISSSGIQSEIIGILENYCIQEAFNLGVT